MFLAIMYILSGIVCSVWIALFQNMKCVDSSGAIAPVVVTRGFALVSVILYFVPVFNFFYMLLAPIVYIGYKYDIDKIKFEFGNAETETKIKQIIKWLKTPLFFAVLFITVSSCMYVPTSDNDTNYEYITTLKYNHGSGCAGHTCSIYNLKFKIDGHDMWLIDVKNVEGYAVVHSPDCEKCKTTEESESEFTYW